MVAVPAFELGVGERLERGLDDRGCEDRLPGLLLALLLGLARGRRAGRVLDLDAHQPDGTAECLRTDPNAWIGSISGASWGVLPNVDEVILPDGEDAAYLEALHGLLSRMPKPDLAFVLSSQPTTEMISIRLYKMAFQEWQTGRSCALAYIVLIMVLAITNIYVKYLNKVKER